MNDSSLLPTLVLAVLGVPFAAACVTWFSGAGARRAAIYLAAGHLILTCVFVAFACGTFDSPGLAAARANFHRFEPHGVPGDPGLANDAPLNITNWTLLPLALPSNQSLNGTAIQFFIGVDGLNIWLIALTSLMTFLAILVSLKSNTDRARGFYCWLFLLQFACLGAFLSFDVLLFYIFFELTLIPAFFLIGSWGVGGGRRDAARKFFLYTLFGSLFTLVGMLGVAITNPAPLHPTSGERMNATAVRSTMPKAGTITLSIPELMENVHVWDEAHQAAVARTKAAAEKNAGDAVKAAKEAEAAQSDRRTLTMWLFFALMAGFAVKVPIVPFHTWLPAAYSEAPLAITMLLSAILAKLGTFGIMRIVLPLVPEAVVTYGLSVFGVMGAIGIVYAAFCAFAQKDLKLLAAYSSVSHLGLLVIGLFALTPESLTGASLHMVNHGLIAGALFALLAFLYDRYRTLDVNQYGGLWVKYPAFTFYFIFISLAAIGLPGLNNFVSEMLLLAGLFDPRNLKLMGFGLAVCAAAGVFLSAWYMFTAVRRVFFGPLREPTGEGVPIASHEWIAFGTLAAFCLTLGLAPQPVLDTITPDVKRVVSATEAARKRLDPNQKSPAEYRREEEKLAGNAAKHP